MTNEARVSLQLSQVRTIDLLTDSTAVLDSMSNNPRFTDPAIPMKTLEADRDTLQTYVIQASDGSRTAIAGRNRSRTVLERDLRMLAAYVTHVADGDAETILSAGFKLAGPRSHSAPPPLNAPAINRIEQGNSGQLLVFVNPVRHARSYEIQFAAGVPDANSVWTSQSLPNTKIAAQIDGLTPGVIYSFRAHAIGRIGYSPWGDPASRMCI